MIDSETLNANSKKGSGQQPYIPADVCLPEITFKALILGFILAAVMCAANVYLGLKIGMTVSATIPAAVISMVVLKFFKHSNILENNIVQTAASAGEVIAAAVAFTLPALVMMGAWSNFPFWTTTALVLIGGLYGVLFSVPLRRAYVVESYLKFPEGIVTGEVLKAGDSKAKGGAKDLLWGGIIAAVVKFSQSGLMILSERAFYWVNVGRTVFGVETGLSLVLLSAGYIVGMQVGFSMLVGAFLAWFVGTPLYAYMFGMPEGLSAYDAAVTIWNGKIRMVGVGTMVVGGLWTLIYLIQPIGKAISSSFATLKAIKMNGKNSVVRTEYDIPMNYVLLASGLLLIPLFFLFKYLVDQSGLSLTPGLYYITITSLTAFAVVLSFLCSSISSYMCGLVGSSNNPLSGVTIMAVLSTALFLVGLLGAHVDLKNDAIIGISAAGLTILLGAIVANAAAVSGDNLQDLKSGQIVGATPWKQQVMLMVGVVAGALAMAPVLQILFKAYGIGNVLPRAGMDPMQALAAPKAALMAAIASSVFAQSLDWSMFGLGALLAFVIILIDEACKRRKSAWRLPILGVAIGVYMPLEISVAVFIGGVIAYMVNRKQQAQGDSTMQNRGLLFCSGMIAGEALVGIALAVPFAAYQATDCFSIAPEGFGPISIGLGIAAFCAIILHLYRISTNKAK